MEQIKSYGIITKPELIEFPNEPSELPMKSNVEEIKSQVADVLTNV